jgi:hypothetical protein
MTVSETFADGKAHHRVKSNLGARKLTGENLKIVWAEFSTISLAVSMM